MNVEKLKHVATQVLTRLPSVKGRGEEATKQALTLPMIDALGYDIWNPEEVCPEFEADFAIKKAGQKEKVDLAISLLGTPKIYLEVKSADCPLEGHEGQLARYFNATPSVALGILTNGVEWRFFTDTGDPNIMDSMPFHIVRLEAIDQGLDVMARFAKPVFSTEAIRDYATELKYTAQIAAFLRGELDLKDKEPSEYFVRWVLKANSMYDGIVNANVVDRFRPIAKAGLSRVIREIVRRSIVAMDEEAAPQTAPAAPDVAVVERSEVESDLADGVRSIVTTERELRAFELVKSVFDASEFARGMIYEPGPKKEIPIELAYKDTTGYFGIYLNKPAWWVARLVIEAKKPWIGFNLEKETFQKLVPPGAQVLEPGAYADCRLAIQSVEDIKSLTPLFLHAIRKTIEDRRQPGV